MRNLLRVPRRLGLVLSHGLVQHLAALLPLLLQVRQFDAQLGQTLLLLLLFGGPRRQRQAQLLLLWLWLDSRR